MIFIPLPGISRREGRAYYARVPSPLGLRRDDDVAPAGAVFLEVQDPAAALMIHVPDAIKGAACYDGLSSDAQARNLVDWERFVDRFLAGAITDPKMAERDVQEVLADDRDALAMALLKLWNWIAEHTPSTCPAPVDLGGFKGCRHMANLPGLPFQEVLRFLSGRLRLAPTELLARFTFSELNLNYHILRGQLKHAAADAEDTAKANLVAIGVEEDAVDE